MPGSAITAINALQQATMSQAEVKTSGAGKAIPVRGAIHGNCRTGRRGPYEKFAGSHVQLTVNRSGLKDSLFHHDFLDWTI